SVPLPPLIDPHESLRVETPSLTVAESNGITIVTIHAHDLVEHTVNAVRPQVLRLLSSGSARWVLDLSEAAFVASAGIGLIIQIAHKLATAGGKVAVCTSRPEVLRLFQGPPFFLESVAIYSSLDEAIHALSPK